MSENELLTIQEVAAYLRVGGQTVEEWAAKGEIPAARFGAEWRFRRAEIERWVDARMGNKPAAPPRSVALADVLDPHRVLFLESLNKHDALYAVIDCLAAAPQVKNKEELAREIFDREALMSTGIGFNVAVPHVRLNSVSDLVLAVGISRQDIPDYASLDELPIRIICMVAARADQHAKYLKTLGAVSGLLKHAQIRASLLAAPDEAAAYAILAGD